MPKKDEFEKLYNKVLKVLHKERADPKLVYEVCMTALLVTSDYLDLPIEEVVTHIRMTGLANEALGSRDVVGKRSIKGSDVTFIIDASDKTVH